MHNQFGCFSLLRIITNAPSEDLAHMAKRDPEGLQAIELALVDLWNDIGFAVDRLRALSGDKQRTCRENKDPDA